MQGFRPGPGGTPPLALTVAAGRPHKSGAVVRFAGCEAREAAEALRGLDLEVPRAEVPSAPSGTYYQYELLGCRCRNNGEELGRVVEVVEDGGGVMLIVEGGGRRVPVPFVKQFLLDVDVARGRIDLALPPGLLQTCASTSLTIFPELFEPFLSSQPARQGAGEGAVAGQGATTCAPSRRPSPQRRRRAVRRRRRDGDDGAPLAARAARGRGHA